MLREDHITVTLDELHRDTVSLRTAERHATVIRVTYQNFRKFSVQGTHEHLRILKFGTSTVQIRIRVVEAHCMVVQLVAEIHDQIRLERITNQREERKRIRVLVRCVDVRDHHDIVVPGLQERGITEVIIWLWLDEHTAFLQGAVGT